MRRESQQFQQLMMWVSLSTRCRLFCWLVVYWRVYWKVYWKVYWRVYWLPVSHSCQTRRSFVRKNSWYQIIKQTSSAWSNPQLKAVVLKVGGESPLRDRAIAGGAARPLNVFMQGPRRFCQHQLGWEPLKLDGPPWCKTGLWWPGD